MIFKTLVNILILIGQLIFDFFLDISMCTRGIKIWAKLHFLPFFVVVNFWSISAIFDPKFDIFAII